jgi:hypothetical protein
VIQFNGPKTNNEVSTDINKMVKPAVDSLQDSIISFRSRFSSESRFSVEIVKSIFSAIVYSIKFVRVLSYLVLFAFMSQGNRKCKYACFFANISGTMQIIKNYQLY